MLGLGRCSPGVGRAAACGGGMLRWWDVPCPTGSSVLPILGCPMGPLHAGVRLQGWWDPAQHHLPRAEAVEKHQDAASNLVGKIKQKVHPGFPCYLFFFFLQEQWL